MLDCEEEFGETLKDILKDDEKAKEAMQGLTAMMNMIGKMAAEPGSGGAGEIPMPSDSETEKMMQELMKMQNMMENSLQDSDNEESK